MPDGTAVLYINSTNTRRIPQMAGAAAKEKCIMATAKKTLFLAQFSMLLAIEAIVCFTPLGSLPAVGPIVATLMMVPVVITGILLGPLPGLAMGGFAGLFSFIVWTFTPPMPLMAFIFTPAYTLGEIRGNVFSLVICFAPRALGGLLAGLIYSAMSKYLLKKEKSEALAFLVGGAVGSLVNTLGVLGGIFVFFGEAYAKAVGAAYGVLSLILGGQVLTSGIPEAILAAIAALAVGVPIKKLMRRGKQAQ